MSNENEEDGMQERSNIWKGAQWITIITIRKKDNIYKEGETGRKTKGGTKL